MPAGAEHDVTRKSWGFYATQSLNARVPGCGLKPLLVGGNGKFFVLLVEPALMDGCLSYLADEGMKVIARLDDPHDLDAIQQALSG